MDGDENLEGHQRKLGEDEPVHIRFVVNCHVCCENKKDYGIN